MKRFVLVTLSLLATIYIQAQDKWPEPKARLRLIVEKDSLFLGDSFDLLVSFEVDNDNQAPLQFYNAGRQLASFINQLKKHGYSVNYGITNIYGRTTTSANGAPTVAYDILKLKIWPERDGIVRFHPIDMDLLQYQPDPNDTTPDRSLSESKLVTFSTEPAKVVVRSQSQAPSSKHLPFAGRLSLKEELPQGTFHVGDSIAYKLVLSGTLPGMKLTLPAHNTDQLQVIPKMVSFTDSITASGSYRFEKTYELTLIPKVQGAIDLSEHFFWRHISTNATNINTQASHEKFIVGAGKKPTKNDLSTDYLLTIDMSESMDLEDYQPNRFEKALTLAAAYRQQQPDGKIIGFAKEIINLSPYKVDEIVRDLNTTTGTGIINSLWLGAEILRSDASHKAIILVCDGDDTASNLTMKELLWFLVRRKVKVYTVGLGHTGKVPFGKDFYGRPNYVENTFQDATMKYIASETGGQYFYIDDYESVEDIIRAISKHMGSN